MLRISLRLMFRGLYRLCGCNCGKLIKVVDKKGRPRRFLKGHDKRGKPFLFANKGEDCYNWKGGRKISNNYYFLLLPDYFSSDTQGYVPEHIYFYQEYYQCCLLPGVVVHHIIPVSKGYCNNMPWNLMAMSSSEHIKLHRKFMKYIKKDMSDRFCRICNGKSGILGGYEHWYGNKEDGWLCNKCYKRINKMW